MGAKHTERVKKKTFSMRQASELLPEVHRITREAVERLETSYLNQGNGGNGGNGAPEDDAAREQLESEANDIVHAWAHHIIALGCEIKGLWLVDFDNGSGYYCWKYPEDRLEYFHSYEEGFSGRMKIN